MDRLDFWNDVNFYEDLKIHITKEDIEALNEFYPTNGVWVVRGSQGQNTGMCSFDPSWPILPSKTLH